MPNQVIENQLCKAIDIIVDQRIRNADFDKTISALILKCEDSSLGKYKVQYQDSIFYAYSENRDIEYNDNTMVYILIPNNDMSKTKTILGTVNRLGVDYITTQEEKDLYNQFGKNFLNSNNILALSSYKTQSVELYNKLNPVNTNLVTLDVVSANEYIKQTSILQCSFTVQTELPIEQQFQGNYGLIYNLSFRDNNTQEKIIRSYILDIDNMVGNPYRMLESTVQNAYFQIDGTNFIEIDSIKMFCKDFPNKDKSKPDDIYISNLKMCGVERTPDENFNGCFLNVLTPQGTFFDKDHDQDKILEGQIRVKGKIANEQNQKLPYYWFVEDISVTSESVYYNKYGGQGWKCLNNFNIIKTDSQNNITVTEFLPGNYKISISKADVLAQEAKYKCVCLYNNTVLSKELTIKNFDAISNVTITSDLGTKFYFDNGRPTLTCSATNLDPNETYKYQWGVMNNKGNFTLLSPTIKYNTQYSNIQKEKEQILESIKKEECNLGDKINRLTELNNKLEELECEERIENNKIIKLQVNNITNFNIYKCSIYHNQQCLGTASITITNNLKPINKYNLVINNGSQLFKYNTNGIAPTSKSLNTSFKIPALSFTIFDNNGQSIQDEAMKFSDIRWVVPSKDTLLLPSSSNTLISVDEVNDTQTYSGVSFVYDISERYYMNKNRNNIRLQVKYKNEILIANTNLVFTKEGESGTNGTDFICKIVPNAASENDLLKQPMVITKDSGEYELNYNVNSTNRKIWFKVQLWKNENKIFEGNETGFSSELDNQHNAKPVIVGWSILKNKYTSKYSDYSPLSIDGLSGSVTYSHLDELKESATIIKATVEYNGNTYYATMPVILLHIQDSLNDYKIDLEDGFGFNSVLYNADGKLPIYNNDNPFSIKVLKKYVTENQEFYWEDISQKKKDEGVDFEWTAQGSVYRGKTREPVKLLTDISNSKIKNNQRFFKPSDSFDGECVNTGILCRIKEKKTHNIIATMWIPIHFLINRYGKSALNGWDGNSISLNEEGGLLLSPQIGVGKKDSDTNTFTGLLMGSVKENDNDQIKNTEVGLLGYYKGQRTIFLDSQTGKAEFGLNNDGRIIIDPSQKKATITSGNYSKNGGMEIDFTTPTIKFGTGNFSVDENGFLTSRGGGTISGWNIGDNQLFKDSVGISSENKEVKNEDGTISHPDIAFWAGNKQKDHAPFRVDFDGKLKSSAGIIGGWTIGANCLYTKNKGFFLPSGEVDKTNGIYLGKDGISLGRDFRVSEQGFISAQSGYIGGWLIGGDYLLNPDNVATDLVPDNSYAVGLSYRNQTWNNTYPNGVYIGPEGITLGKNFWVNNQGDIVAKSGTFSGELNAPKGNIGGWTIGVSCLYTNYKGFYNPDGSIDQNPGIYLGNDGISLGKSFRVSTAGTVSAQSGYIGGWVIGGDYSDGSTISPSLPDGSYAVGLSYNGQTYMKTTDYGAYIGPEGITLGKNFWVDNQGNLTAKSGTFSGTLDVQSGIIKMGGTILKSQNGSSWTSLPSGSTYIDGSGTLLSQYIENLAAGQITAKRINSIFSNSNQLTVDTIVVHSNLKVGSGVQTYGGKTQNVTIGGKTLVFKNGVFIGTN